MNVDRFNERKWFHPGKHNQQTIPTQTNMDADNADDMELRVNSQAQAESLRHSQKKAAGGIGFHVNADKTEFTSFNQNQRGDTSTLKRCSLKLVDTFIYLGSSVSFTENDINTRRAKSLSAIDRLLVISKSDLSDKIKRNFFQPSMMSILLYGCTTETMTKRIEKSLTAIVQESTSYIEKNLEAIFRKRAAVNHPIQKNKTCGTLLEK